MNNSVQAQEQDILRALEEARDMPSQFPPSLMAPEGQQQEEGFLSGFFGMLNSWRGSEDEPEVATTAPVITAPRITPDDAVLEEFRLAAEARELAAMEAPFTSPNLVRPMSLTPTSEFSEEAMPAVGGEAAAPVETTDTAAIDEAVAEAVAEAAGSGEGLMSRRFDNVIGSFVDLMGEREGTQDHTAQEGQFTYGYGILPSTAAHLGINADDYATRKEFATAVYGKMRSNAMTAYPDVFEGLKAEDQMSVLSLYINLGKLPTGVVNALSGEDKDFTAAGDSFVDVIHYEDKKTGVMYASKGISKRRAAEWNAFMEGREGYREVVSVDVTGTKASPTFRWLDADGNVVKSFTSNHPLSPSNSMTAIRLN